MLAAQLKSHVESILAQPNAKQRIEAVAAASGTTRGPDDKDGLAALCEGYIRSRDGSAAGLRHRRDQRRRNPVRGPLLQTAAGYFPENPDYIPDAEDTWGLLDDAYLACRFVARISEFFAAARGIPLLDTSLDERSPVIRVLIGEPLASRLDADVEQTIAEVTGQLQLAQMEQWQLPGGGWSQWASQQNVINTEAEIMHIASGGF